MIKLLVLACLVCIAVAAKDVPVCRAIAFGGGGDRGAYEAGALKALVELQDAEKVRYEVVTGISAGSWNAAGLSQYKIGDEKAASAFMTEQWLNIKASDVWTNWYPGGILEGMWLKSGLLDSSPQLTYAQRFVNLTRLRSSGRTVHVGATSLDRSEFMLFNQTDDNFPRAVLASSAIPGIFPVVEIAGDHFVDGGIEYMTPISDAIATCMRKYEEQGINNVKVNIDVVLAIADTPMPAIFKKLLITPLILLRTFVAVLDNIFIEDIQSAHVAFPNAQIRVIKPQTWLPGYFLGFQYSKQLLDAGYQDAVRVLNQTKDYWY